MASTHPCINVYFDNSYTMIFMFMGLYSEFEKKIANGPFFLIASHII